MGLLGWLFNSGSDNIDSKVNDIPKKISYISDFEAIASYLYDQIGITDLTKRIVVTNQLKELASDHEIENSSQFIRRLQADRDFFQKTVNIVTVNQTYFFREYKELSWLCNYIQEQDKRLKILSLPSSSGEEIYSIKIMLSEIGYDLNKVDFVGYDINSDIISHANSGRYEKFSLHQLDNSVVEGYFKKDEKGFYHIDHTIKSNVLFMQNNIFDLQDAKESYDIILSRNMFIYFDDIKQKKATDVIVDLLRPNGIFIKGHADNIYAHPSLKSLSYGVYKKV